MTRPRLIRTALLVVAFGRPLRQRGPVTKKWQDLSPRTRQLIVIGSAFEGVLKIAALADLLRRPPEEVRGSKSRWAAAIILINSLGAVPIIYVRRGRRT